MHSHSHIEEEYPQNHWELVWSEEFERYYYQDRFSGLALWQRPEDCELDADEETDKRWRAQGKATKTAKLQRLAQLKLKARLPPNWRVFLDRTTGRRYYYNEKTKERTWYKPVLLDDSVLPTHRRSSDKSSLTMSGLRDDQYDGHVDRARITKGVSQANEVIEKMVKNNLSKCIWDAPSFKARLQAYKEDPGRHEAVMREIAESNEQWVAGLHMHVPTTLYVSYHDCYQAMVQGKVTSYHMEPLVTISSMTVCDAIEHFCQDTRRVICVVNSAHGRFADRYSVHKLEVAHGYLHGSSEDSSTEEDDLCRRIPNFFASLREADKEGLYPFGPPTLVKGQYDEGKYSDVLYTPQVEKRKGSGTPKPGLELLRQGSEHGYDFVPEEERGKHLSVVSAVPARTEHGSEDVFDSKFLAHTITSIFVAPVLKNPRTTTLIIGAWGMDGSDHPPDVIARPFAEAIVHGRDCGIADGSPRARDKLVLGELYHEIHFALGSQSRKDEGKCREVFRKTFRYFDLDFKDM